MSHDYQESLEFLRRLCDEGVLSWPIDFEFYQPDISELETTFGLWFGSDEWAKEGDSFIQFGQDGTGSMYLLWFYPGLVEQPPVVFMGSEGEKHLVASNIADFMRQLGSGKIFGSSYSSPDGGWYEPEPEELQELDWQKLKRRIEERFGRLIHTAEKLQSLAIETHPDFTAWVESKTKY